MNNEELWKAVLGEVELSISKANFITWFRDTRVISEENGKVLIGVPSGFAQEWLENRYNHYILRALQKYRSSVTEISCVIEGETGAQAKQGIPITRPLDAAHQQGATMTAFPRPFSSSPLESGIAASARPSGINPRYTFESFIVGENNELARAACYAVAHNLGRLYNPLFVYGGVGLGKTHLLQAIGNEILKTSPDTIIKYTTSERFTNELIEAIRNQTMNTFKDVYQKVDLLLIDDIQFLSGREKTQNEFFHIFNSLHQLNKQIVLTSDRPPHSIPTIEDRLRSRFAGGMMADIGRPNLETRMAILGVKMADRSIRLDAESIRFIAEHITNNVRELEGALNRILAACEFHQVPPSLAYTKKILGALVVEKRRAVTLESLSQAVANFYHVPAEDLMKKTRKKEVVYPRQIAMYLIREELQSPFSTIGRYFGGRDHTTTMHACEKISKEIEKSMQLKEELRTIKEQVYQNANEDAQERPKE